MTSHDPANFTFWLTCYRTGSTERVSYPIEVSYDEVDNPIAIKELCWQAYKNMRRNAAAVETE